jgi:hypothetical protein
VVFGASEAVGLWRPEKAKRLKKVVDRLKKRL